MADQLHRHAPTPVTLSSCCSILLPSYPAQVLFVPLFFTGEAPE